MFVSALVLESTILHHQSGNECNSHCRVFCSFSLDGQTITPSVAAPTDLAKEWRFVETFAGSQLRALTSNLKQQTLPWPTQPTSHRLMPLSRLPTMLSPARGEKRAMGPAKVLYSPRVPG